MASTDRADDDRTFKVDFSTEGVAKLRERVRDKLKEFMGDYTDDTLVEYVIVLLRNGRRKEEAKNELNIFLGDDNESFVAWLWDHLAERLDEYLHHQDSHVEDAIETKSLISGQNENKDSVQIDSESEKREYSKLPEGRRTRQWRSQPTNAVEPPPLISSEVHKIHYVEKKDHEVRHDRRSPSPQSQHHKKRDRIDDQQHEQMEAKQDVSCRLLQFAVRDALATSKPSNSPKKPSLKRLRSVVSASTPEASAPDPPRRIRSVARVVNPMATVFKAVAEAAEDVKKTKPSRSVFDRISHCTDETLEFDQHVGFTEAASEVDVCKDLNEDDEQIQPRYPWRRNYNGTYDDDMLKSGTGLDPNIMSGDSRLNLDANVSYANISGGNKVDSTNMEHNVAVQVDGVKRVKRNNYQSYVIEAASRHKRASFFGDMDPGKTSKLQVQREVTNVGPKKSLQERKIIASEAIMPSSNENTTSVAVDNGNVKPVSNNQKEAPKTQISGPGTFSTIRSSADADSRTIFVTNVHFGATKDGLSRHFNKFGEVLKVLIVTDPATGQPTGSAYIEFTRKEAAGNALSLDGTSFMSRILKIVKGSTTQQEVAPTMTWSRGGRGSPYSGARFARAPYARGITGAFRGRPPIRPGARSLQWKRDSPAEAGPSGSGNAGSTRSLTYIRTDTKPVV